MGFEIDKGRQHLEITKMLVALVILAQQAVRRSVVWT